MLKYNLWQRFRHVVKKIPGMIRMYDLLYLHLFPRFSRDGLLTTHIPCFLSEPEFTSAYAAGYSQEPALNLKWRTHTLLWAAKQVRALKGDFVECGVNRGFMSAAVMKYLDFEKISDKKFYLFDTFCGLDEELVSAEEMAVYRNEYPDCHEFVMRTLGCHSNVVVVKGLVPYTLDSVNIEKVAFLHIDMNCAAPERAAADFFWPKIVSGGILVFDDYGFEGHEIQAREADEFARGVGHEVLCLPTGQGMIVKR